jgi:hypothetical protein
MLVGRNLTDCDDDLVGIDAESPSHRLGEDDRVLDDHHPGIDTFTRQD